MDIKILGTGCAKCHTLEKTVKEVIAEHVPGQDQATVPGHGRQEIA